MNPKPIKEARDADLRNMLAALERAGTHARTVAALTNTDIIYVENGKLVREKPLASDLPYLRVLD